MASLATILGSHSQYATLSNTTGGGQLSNNQIVTKQASPLVKSFKNKNPHSEQYSSQCNGNSCAVTSGVSASHDHHHHKLSIVHCPLSIVHCPLSIVNYPLSIVTALLIAFCLLFGTKAFAQTTATIGTGTSTNYYPMPGYFGWQYDVYLYTPSAADFLNNNCSISSIAWQISSGSTNSAQMTIWVKDVDASTTLSTSNTFSSFTSGATQVYSGSKTTSTGWNTYSFSSSFSHQAGKALLVAVKGVGCETNGGCSRNCYYTSASSTHWYKHQDNSDPGTSVTGTVDGNRSNIQITYTAATTPTIAAAASVPYSCDFEDATENGKWTLDNGTQTNKWIIGTNTYSSSSHSLYISNNGSTNGYTNTSTSYVYAYRKLNFSTAGDYIVSFKWKANGESTYDLLRAFLIPVSANPTLSGGTDNGMSGYTNTNPSGWIEAGDQNGKLNLKTDWQISNYDVSITNTGDYYLVFFWKNDDSQGSAPPAAVDDIKVKPVCSPNPISFASCPTTVAPGALISCEPTSSRDGGPFSYVSSSPSVATINNNGIVTGVATGSTTIYASTEFDECVALGTHNVTVAAPASQTQCASCSGWTFEKATETFTQIQGKTGCSTVSSTFTDDASVYLSLPFTFNVCGSSYSYVYVSSNGEITLGNSNSSPTGYSASNYAQIIPFGTNLNPKTSYNASSSYNIYKMTLGTSPNRIFIIEWYNIYLYNTTSGQTFQIWLYEGTGVIEFHYGTCNPNGTQSVYTGIRGTATSEFLFLSGTDWASPSISTTATTRSYSSSYKPSSGLIYRFTPKNSVDATISAASSFCGSSTTLTVPSGNNVTYSWDNGATTATREVTASGTYRVTASSRNCTATSSISVTKSTPSLSIPATVDCGGQLVATAASGYDINWYTDGNYNTILSSGATYPSAPTANGTYYAGVSADFNFGNLVAYDVHEYEYSGDIETLPVPSDAEAVMLEVWGAQGGDGNTAGTGGKGGYSVGTLSDLSGISNLYICVGGAGNSYSSSTKTGGYNGGGNWVDYGGSGGGATHIAKSSGLLTTFASTYSSQLLIVAGGGGGGGWSSVRGGYGGGAVGGPGIGLNASYANGTGGTQTSGGTTYSGTYGGSFGTAAASRTSQTISSSNVANGGGGGGGFYGGGAGTGGGTDSGGGGGSGYVNPILIGASTEGGVRTGAGFARVTFLKHSQTCSATQSQTVSVTPASLTLPTISDQTICSGNSVTLNATPTSIHGTPSYNWSPSTGLNATNTASVTASPTAEQTYTYEVTATLNSNNSCTASAYKTVKVKVNTAPTVSIGKNPNSTELTCSRTSITLTPTVTGTASSASWSGSGSGSNAINATTGGTYTYTVSNGCGSNSASVDITLNKTAPTAVITKSPDVTQIDCTNASISLTAAGGGNYAWSNDATTASYGSALTEAGKYTVTVTTPSNGCTGTASVTLTKDVTAPTVEISGTAPVCAGVSTTLSTTSNDNYSYLWSNSGDNNSITVTPMTETGYSVTVTDNVNGCTAAQENFVVAVNSPNPSGIAENDFVWSGNIGTDWNATGNWLKKSASAYSVASSAPTSSNNVFIVTYGSCVNNDPILSVNSSAKNITIGADKNLNLNGNTLNIAGDLYNDGMLTATSGTVVFNGSADQTISNAVTFGNVTIAQTVSGKKITAPNGITVNGLATFGTGVVSANVSFGGSASATGASLTSYVDGTVTKTLGSSDFTFPTGSNGVLGSVTVPATRAGGSATIRFNKAASEHGYTTDEGYPRWWNINDMCSEDGNNRFDHVSNAEYWDISTSADLSGVTLRSLGATDVHFNNSVANSYDANDIKVAVYNGCWKNIGGTASVSNDHTEISVSGITLRAVCSGGYKTTFGSLVDNTVLPIELLSFTATCDGRSSLVEWTTATEKNNDYFSLERSDDAVNFIEIARVAGAGNSIEPIDYAYTDYGIHGGDNYYRLVQVDYDGTRTASEVIVANCIEPEVGEPDVLAYPNPFSSDLTVVLDNFGNRAATIEVYDMLGKLIYTNKVAAPQNSYETILNLSNLPPAAYTVRVSTADFVINRNVVKQ